MSQKKHWFIKWCSTSVLMAYVIAMIFLIIMLFFDSSIDMNRIITAIGTGGILIVAGDLLRSPFNLSSNFHRLYNDLAKVCDTHGKNTQNLLKNKKDEADKNAVLYAVNEEKETVLLYSGSILTMLGFSSLLLVFVSDVFYEIVFSRQPFITIISFVFLLFGMIVKEYGEHSLEKISQEKEQVENIANLQLKQEYKRNEVTLEESHSEMQ